MSKISLAKALSNSTFEDCTIPYRTFINKNKSLLAVANSFLTQWPARHISMQSQSLLLYSLNNIGLIGSIENLDYNINDVSFHPTEPIIAIGIGQYDGGAYFEGAMLIWNYKTNEVRSIIKDNREVTKCGFNESGRKLHFTVNPTDDLDCPDYTDKEFSIDFPVVEQISLNRLIPVSATEHIDDFNINEYNSRFLNAESFLSEISSQQNRSFINRHLIWDLLFINETTIAVALNNATVEIWNIVDEKCKEIKLDDIGECVELFLNTSNNSLLVNVWNKNYSSNFANTLYYINLDTFEYDKIIHCHHTISKTEDNYFLARQTDYSDKTKKDFILDPLYNIIFEERLGHYDLFNHYIRIDNAGLLYCLLGKPSNSYQNKTLYAIDPKTLSKKEVWQLEKSTTHYNDLNGVLVKNDLLLSGKVYSSNRNPYNTYELFCVDLSTKKEKWLRTTKSQICSFGVLNNSTLMVMALADGNIELIDIVTGKTIEVLQRSKKLASSYPLSIATFENKIAVGLVNGQIEIYEAK